MYFIIKMVKKWNIVSDVLKKDGIISYLFQL